MNIIMSVCEQVRVRVCMHAIDVYGIVVVIEIVIGSASSGT